VVSGNDLHGQRTIVFGEKMNWQRVTTTLTEFRVYLVTSLSAAVGQDMRYWGSLCLAAFVLAWRTLRN